MAPETIDLDPPGDALRRGLTLIAKIIQNLANNIFFGKEAHMMVLNDFLRDHIAHVTRYLSELNVSTINIHICCFQSSQFLEIYTRRRRRGRVAWNSFGRYGYHRPTSVL